MNIERVGSKTIEVNKGDRVLVKIGKEWGKYRVIGLSEAKQQVRIISTKSVTGNGMWIDKVFVRCVIAEMETESRTVTIAVDNPPEGGWTEADRVN